MIRAKLQAQTLNYLSSFCPPLLSIKGKKPVTADSQPYHPIFSSFIITSGVKSNVSYKVRQNSKDTSHANNIETLTKTILIMIQMFLFHFKFKVGLNFTSLSWSKYFFSALHRNTSLQPLGGSSFLSSQGLCLFQLYWTHRPLNSYNTVANIAYEIHSAFKTVLLFHVFSLLSPTIEEEF